MSRVQPIPQGGFAGSRSAMDPERGDARLENEPAPPSPPALPPRRIVLNGTGPQATDRLQEQEGKDLGLPSTAGMQQVPHRVHPTSPGSTPAQAPHEDGSRERPPQSSSRAQDASQEGASVAVARRPPNVRRVGGAADRQGGGTIWDEFQVKRQVHVVPGARRVFYLAGLIWLVGGLLSYAATAEPSARSGAMVVVSVLLSALALLLGGYATRWPAAQRNFSAVAAITVTFAVSMDLVFRTLAATFADSKVFGLWQRDDEDVFPVLNSRTVLLSVGFIFLFYLVIPRTRDYQRALLAYGLVLGTSYAVQATVGVNRASETWNTKDVVPFQVSWERSLFGLGVCLATVTCLALYIHRTAMLKSWAAFVQRKRLQLEAIRAEEFLTLAMPRQIAHELMQGVPHARFFQSASVAFIYISEYKKKVYDASEEIIRHIEHLHLLYVRLDTLVLQYRNVYKIESVGNCYMVAGGIPDECEDHAAALLRFCIAALELVKGLRSQPNEVAWDLKIGLHSGPVATGVVGLSRTFYRLFGDTVNTASRMGSRGEAGRIHISEDAYRELGAPQVVNPPVILEDDEPEQEGDSEMEISDQLLEEASSSVADDQNSRGTGGRRKSRSGRRSVTRRKVRVRRIKLPMDDWPSFMFRDAGGHFELAELPSFADFFERRQRRQAEGLRQDTAESVEEEELLGILPFLTAECRGRIPVKGKGMMKTYFINLPEESAEDLNESLGGEATSWLADHSLAADGASSLHPPAAPGLAAPALGSGGSAAGAPPPPTVDTGAPRIAWGENHSNPTWHGSPDTRSSWTHPTPGAGGAVPHPNASTPSDGGKTAALAPVVLTTRALVHARALISTFSNRPHDPEETSRLRARRKFRTAVFSLVEGRRRALADFSGGENGIALPSAASGSQEPEPPHGHEEAHQTAESEPRPRPVPRRTIPTMSFGAVAQILAAAAAERRRLGDRRKSLPGYTGLMMTDESPHADGPNLPGAMASPSAYAVVDSGGSTSENATMTPLASAAPSSSMHRISAHGTFRRGGPITPGAASATPAANTPLRSFRTTEGELLMTPERASSQRYRSPQRTRMAAHGSYESQDVVHVSRRASASDMVLTHLPASLAPKGSRQQSRSKSRPRRHRSSQSRGGRSRRASNGGASESSDGGTPTGKGVSALALKNYYADKARRGRSPVARYASADPSHGRAPLSGGSGQFRFWSEAPEGNGGEGAEPVAPRRSPSSAPFRNGLRLHRYAGSEEVMAAPHSESETGGITAEPSPGTFGREESKTPPPVLGLPPSRKSRESADTSKTGGGGGGEGAGEMPARMPRGRVQAAAAGSPEKSLPRSASGTAGARTQQQVRTLQRAPSAPPVSPQSAWMRRSSDGGAILKAADLERLFAELAEPPPRGAGSPQGGMGTFSRTSSAPAPGERGAPNAAPEVVHASRMRVASHRMAHENLGMSVASTIQEDENESLETKSVGIGSRRHVGSPMMGPAGQAAEGTTILRTPFTGSTVPTPPRDRFPSDMSPLSPPDGGRLRIHAARRSPPTSPLTSDGDSTDGESDDSSGSEGDSSESDGLSTIESEGGGSATREDAVAEDEEDGEDRGDTSPLRRTLRGEDEEEEEQKAEESIETSDRFRYAQWLSTVAAELLQYTTSEALQAYRYVSDPVTQFCTHHFVRTMETMYLRRFLHDASAEGSTALQTAMANVREAVTQDAETGSVEGVTSLLKELTSSGGLKLGIPVERRRSRSPSRHRRRRSSSGMVQLAATSELDRSPDRTHPERRSTSSPDRGRTYSAVPPRSEDEANSMASPLRTVSRGRLPPPPPAVPPPSPSKGPRGGNVSGRRSPSPPGASTVLGHLRGSREHASPDVRMDDVMRHTAGAAVGSKPITAVDRFRAREPVAVEAERSGPPDLVHEAASARSRTHSAQQVGGRSLEVSAPSHAARPILAESRSRNVSLDLHQLRRELNRDRARLQFAMEGRGAHTRRGSGWKKGADSTPRNDWAEEEDEEAELFKLAQQDGPLEPRSSRRTKPAAGSLSPDMTALSGPLREGVGGMSAGGGSAGSGGAGGASGGPVWFGSLALPGPAPPSARGQRRSDAGPSSGEAPRPTGSSGEHSGPHGIAADGSRRTRRARMLRAASDRLLVQQRAGRVKFAPPPSGLGPRATSTGADSPPGSPLSSEAAFAAPPRRAVGGTAVVRAPPPVAEEGAGEGGVMLDAPLIASPPFGARHNAEAAPRTGLQTVEEVDEQAMSTGRRESARGEISRDKTARSRSPDIGGSGGQQWTSSRHSDPDRTSSPGPSRRGSGVTLERGMRARRGPSSESSGRSRSKRTLDLQASVGQSRGLESAEATQSVANVGGVSRTTVEPNSPRSGPASRLGNSGERSKERSGISGELLRPVLRRSAEEVEEEERRRRKKEKKRRKKERKRRRRERRWKQREEGGGDEAALGSAKPPPVPTDEEGRRSSCMPCCQRARWCGRRRAEAGEEGEGQHGWKTWLWRGCFSPAGGERESEDEIADPTSPQAGHRSLWQECHPREWWKWIVSSSATRFSEPILEAKFQELKQRQLYHSYKIASWILLILSVICLLVVVLGAQELIVFSVGMLHIVLVLDIVTTQRRFQWMSAGEKEGVDAEEAAVEDMAKQLGRGLVGQRVASTEEPGGRERPISSNEEDGASAMGSPTMMGQSAGALDVRRDSSFNSRGFVTRDTSVSRRVSASAAPSSPELLASQGLDLQLGEASAEMRPRPPPINVSAPAMTVTSGVGRSSNTLPMLNLGGRDGGGGGDRVSPASEAPTPTTPSEAIRNVMEGAREAVSTPPPQGVSPAPRTGRSDTATPPRVRTEGHAATIGGGYSINVNIGAVAQETGGFLTAGTPMTDAMGQRLRRSASRSRDSPPRMRHSQTAGTPGARSSDTESPSFRISRGRSRGRGGPGWGEGRLRRSRHESLSTPRDGFVAPGTPPASSEDGSGVERFPSWNVKMRRSRSPEARQALREVRKKRQERLSLRPEMSGRKGLLSPEERRRALRNSRDEEDGEEGGEEEEKGGGTRPLHPQPFVGVDRTELPSNAQSPQQPAPPSRATSSPEGLAGRPAMEPPSVTNLEQVELPPPSAHSRSNVSHQSHSVRVSPIHGRPGQPAGGSSSRDFLPGSLDSGRQERKAGDRGDSAHELRRTGTSMSHAPDAMGLLVEEEDGESMGSPTTVGAPALAEHHSMETTRSFRLPPEALQTWEYRMRRMGRRCLAAVDRNFPWLLSLEFAIVRQYVFLVVEMVVGSILFARVTNGGHYPGEVEAMGSEGIADNYTTALFIPTAIALFGSLLVPLSLRGQTLLHCSAVGIHAVFLVCLGIIGGDERGAGAGELIRGYLVFLFISGVIISRSRMDDSISRRAVVLRLASRRAKQQADQVLEQLLPSQVINRLRENVSIPFSVHDTPVVILWADLVGFTALSSKFDPRLVMAILNVLYARFDLMVESEDLWKMDTIGDAYVVLGGLMNSAKGHELTERLFRIATQMRHVTHQIRKALKMDINIRIGIHAGPVATGIIGTLRPRFHVFGPTVLEAEQMESEGRPGWIQVSESAVSLFRSRDFRLRGRRSLAEPVIPFPDVWQAEVVRKASGTAAAPSVAASSDLPPAIAAGSVGSAEEGMAFRKETPRRDGLGALRSYWLDPPDTWTKKDK